MFKKVYNIVFVCVLLMSMILVFGLNAEVVYAAETPFYDDFNSYTGSTPAGWSATNPGQMTSEAISGASTSIKLTTTTSINDVTIRKQFATPITGKITLKAQVKPADTTHKRPMFFIKDSGNRESFMLAFSNNGNIIRYTDTSSNYQIVQTYSANKWYEVKIVLD